MKLRTLTVLICAIFLMAMAAPDRWIGTWKLNPLRSKFQFGAPPKNRTVIFEATPAGVKGVSDLLDAQGSLHIEFTTMFDGKDVPMRGTPPGTTIACTRINASTFDTVQKSDGIVTATTHYVVSLDGKTLTASAVGTNPDGAKFTNVSVYEKQP